jgi:hypothetical protein
MAGPAHVVDLISNTEEVFRLFGIHEELSGTGPGRRHKLEILNKSGVVLLVACWEAFVEDLATAAFDVMLAKATSHTVFPSKVLAMAAKPLRESNDEREVWRLADAGWKTVLQNHRASVIKRLVGDLNTPRPTQVDSLFEELIGLRKISTLWHWHGTTATQAAARLNRMVTVRGDIAHRVKASAAVRKQDVNNGALFISRLAAKSSNAVRQHLFDRLGQYPWTRVSYKSVG